MSTEPNTNLVICDHFDEQKCDPQCCHSKPHAPEMSGGKDWADNVDNVAYYCDSGREVCGWRHDAPTCICVPCNPTEAK